MSPSLTGTPAAMQASTSSPSISTPWPSQSRSAIRCASRAPSPQPRSSTRDPAGTMPATTSRSGLMSRRPRGASARRRSRPCGGTRARAAGTSRGRAARRSRGSVTGTRAAVRTRTISRECAVGKRQSVSKESTRKRVRAAAQPLDRGRAVAERVEVVHHAREIEIAVGVEAVEEALALVLEVALDREVDAEAVQRLAVVLQPAPELGAHRLLGEIRDVRDAAGQREALVGAHAVLVVVAAVEVLVLHDGRARDGAEGDVLGGQASARADHEPRAQLIGVIERPLQHLHAADRPADRRERALDAEVTEQPPVHGHEIAHGAEREAQAVGLAGGRVDRRGARRALAAAQQVRADDEQPVGVDRLAGADQVVPPARPRGVAVMAGGVGVAGQRVADEDAVGSRRRRARRRSRRRPRPAPAARPSRARAGRARPRARPAVSRPVRASAVRPPAGLRREASRSCRDRDPGPRERLLEVGEDVLDVLDADREAHGVLRHARRPRAPPR